MIDPLVVAAFRSEGEAAEAQRVLDGAGIASDVQPRSDSIERRCADAFDSGFDVIVDAERADTAIAVLQRFWPDTQPPPIEERCPACGSASVTRIRRLVLFAIVATVLLMAGALTGERDLFFLLTAIIGVLLVLTPNRKCRSCGERWRGSLTPAPDDATESPGVICPRCTSDETETLVRRREKALTLLVNLAIPPAILVWPFLSRHRCLMCGYEWR